MVAQGEIRVDVGMWGGLVADNAGDHAVLQGMLDAGALGFKSFMVPSGVVTSAARLLFCETDHGEEHISYTIN